MELIGYCITITSASIKVLPSQDEKRRLQNKAMVFMACNDQHEMVCLRVAGHFMAGSLRVRSRWSGRKKNEIRFIFKDEKGKLPSATMRAVNAASGTWRKWTTLAKGRSEEVAIFYPRPTPTYWNPMALRRTESSKFLVSMIRGRFSRCLILSKSRPRNSGQPVPTTRASTPSAAA